MLEQHGDNPCCHLNLALAYKDNAQWREMLASLDKALRLCGSEDSSLDESGQSVTLLPLITFHKAEAMKGLKRMQDAFSLYKQAIELSDRCDISKYSTLAICQIALGVKRFSETEKTLTRVLNDASIKLESHERGCILYTLGCVLIEMKRLEDAEAQLIYSLDEFEDPAVFEKLSSLRMRMYPHHDGAVYSKNFKYSRGPGNTRALEKLTEGSSSLSMPEENVLGLFRRQQ